MARPFSSSCLQKAAKNGAEAVAAKCAISENSDYIDGHLILNIIVFAGFGSSKNENQNTGSRILSRKGCAGTNLSVNTS